MNNPRPRFAVAPMLDWTDRHDRYFLRLFSPHVQLYTEMITTHALLHGPRQRLLRYDDSEHPVVLQLGGSDPVDLARCARIAGEHGYDEINLNLGCPSDRVQQGRFGACLMAEPALVADCFAAMQAASTVPVSVKHRLGIDGHDSLEELYHFVDSLRQAGCRHFVVHARIAILKGLSPKENRDVPPLRYADVHALKRRYPDLWIALNGGLRDVDTCLEQLQQVDAVMLGREAYHNPYILALLEHQLHATALPSRTDILRRYLDFVDRELAEGCPLTQMSRHLLGLFQGLPGARRWRQYLSEHAHQHGAGRRIIEEAWALVDQAEST